MNTLKYSFKAAGIAAVSALAMSTSAQALTLDTTFLQANSVFALSQDALDVMSASSTTMSSLGNASAAASIKSATGDMLPAFNLPVTK
ncbi:MAG: hypothetical protein HYX44_15310, partial [Aquabacterium sp.]|nr:hypothetical protein [Aquabacterium sp.]